jgi:hypothetical protein
MGKARFAVLAVMVLAVVASRLIPHAPNFTPLAALALFSGASFAGKRAAFLVPLCGLLLSDLVLGFYPISAFVYGSVALITCLGFWLRRRNTVSRLAGTTLAGALLFFVVTNFGVWVLGAWYPRTVAGLGECFVAAIPFLGNTVASDLLYSALLFGGLALLEKRWPRLAERVPAAA